MVMEAAAISSIDLGDSAMATLRIGTRGSPLALAQAMEVRARLWAEHPDLGPHAIAIVPIKTTGDQIQDRTLAEAGGKGLFTKEIEEALLAGTIDLAVHSMKDVPTWLPDRLAMSCYLPREDPRDALFTRGSVASLSALPKGAVIGTASLRRQAQILCHRPDLRVVPIRGNVQTRLRKLDAGDVDATLLALAGLRRLGLTDRVTCVLEPTEMLPAVAQGAIGIEIRADDDATRARLEALDCASTRARVTAERALLAVLDGSCRTPIAALATLDDDGGIALSGLVAEPNGRWAVRVTRTGRADEAAEVGHAAGQQIKDMLPADFIMAASPPGAA